MSLRVVIVTRIPPVLAAFDAVVRAAGHEPVAFLTMRNVDGRYGPPAETGDLVMTAARRARRPPARAPEHDRAAARLGRARPRRLHGLPVEDPARRARRAAPRLAQRPPVAPAAPSRPAAGRVGDPRGRRGDRDHVPPDGRRARHRADPRSAAVSRSGSCSRRTRSIPSSAPRSARRSARRSRSWPPATKGTPQPEGGNYETFFAEEDAWLDLSRPAAEVHRLVWAWRFAFSLARDPRRAARARRHDGARARDLADGGRGRASGSTAATGRSGSSRRRTLSEEEATPSSDPAPSTQ